LVSKFTENTFCHTFGFGKAVNKNLVKELADAGKGYSYIIDDISS